LGDKRESQREKGTKPIARESCDPDVTKTASAVGKSLFEPSQPSVGFPPMLVATLLEPFDFSVKVEPGESPLRRATKTTAV